MKPAGFSLLCLVATGTLLAGEPAASDATPAPISAVIRAGLPAYNPPAPVKPAASPAATEPAPADPDTLVLPKVTVRERHQPRIHPIDLMTPAALERKFAVDYKKSLTGLDAFLNGFSIPLFGPSLAARGRAQYQAQQMADLSFIINARADDPKSAAGLQAAEAEMNLAIERQDRPAGSK